MSVSWCDSGIGRDFSGGWSFFFWSFEPILVGDSNSVGSLLICGISCCIVSSGFDFICSSFGILSFSSNEASPILGSNKPSNNGLSLLSFGEADLACSLFNCSESTSTSGVDLNDKNESSWPADAELISGGVVQQNLERNIKSWEWNRNKLQVSLIWILYCHHFYCVYKSCCL